MFRMLRGWKMRTLLRNASGAALSLKQAAMIVGGCKLETAPPVFQTAKFRTLKTHPPCRLWRVEVNVAAVSVVLGRLLFDC